MGELEHADKLSNNYFNYKRNQKNCMNNIIVNQLILLLSFSCIDICLQSQDSGLFTPIAYVNDICSKALIMRH